MRTLQRFAVFTVCAIVALFAVTGCANSTPGVRVVGDNVIELPVGETAVFSATNGKLWLTWTVTFDGRDTVKFSCHGVCFDSSAHVPNVGDADQASSSTLYGHFDVTRVSRDAVHVYWPYGITISLRE